MSNEFIHCAIGLENQDGSIEGVYCYQNGEPEVSGLVLFEYYSLPERIEDLVSHGDLVCLGKELNECEFYIDDRGESDEDAGSINHDSYEEFINFYRSSGCDHFYIFRDNSWLYSSIQNPEQIELSTVVEKIILDYQSYDDFTSVELTLEHVQTLVELALYHVQSGSTSTMQQDVSLIIDLLHSILERTGK